MKRIILVVMLAALAAPTWAQEFQLPPGRWWENPRVAERVRLTPDQQDQLRALVLEHARRMIDLVADVRRAELDLKDLVGRPTLDVAAVRTAFANLQKARQKLESDRFELLLSVRQTLSFEQWRALLELRAEHRRMQRDEQPEEPGPQRPRPPGPRR